MSAGLTSLDLKRCDQVTDAGLAHVAQLKQLASLNLKSCNKITIGGLISLSQLSSLKQLALPRSGNLPSSADLAYVMALPQTTTLDLKTCKNLTGK